MRGLGLIKRAARALLGKKVDKRVEVKCRTKRFGSEYGGWVVATTPIGRDTIVYSFGVGTDATFDVEMIRRYALRIHAFDPTPKSIDWAKNQNMPDAFVFHPYGIADFDGDVTFNPPENPDYVSHTMLDRPETADRAIVVPVKRLSTIMQELGDDRIDVLKLDIEGAEYAVFEDLCKTQIRPGQILVEFHHDFPGVGYDKTQRSIDALKGIGYRIFSVSDNGAEFSFIRNPS